MKIKKVINEATDTKVELDKFMSEWSGEDKSIPANWLENETKFKNMTNLDLSTFLKHVDFEEFNLEDELSPETIVYILKSDEPFAYADDYDVVGDHVVAITKAIRILGLKD